MIARGMEAFPTRTSISQLLEGKGAEGGKEKEGKEHEYPVEPVTRKEPAVAFNSSGARRTAEMPAVQSWEAKNLKPPLPGPPSQGNSMERPLPGPPSAVKDAEIPLLEPRSNTQGVRTSLPRPPSKAKSLEGPLPRTHTKTEGIGRKCHRSTVDYPNCLWKERRDSQAWTAYLLSHNQAVDIVYNSGRNMETITFLYIVVVY